MIFQYICFVLVFMLVNNKIITITIHPKVIVKFKLPVPKYVIDNVHKVMGKISLFCLNFFIQEKNKNMQNPIRRTKTIPPNKNPISFVTI